MGRRSERLTACLGSTGIRGLEQQGKTSGDGDTRAAFAKVQLMAMVASWSAR